MSEQLSKPERKPFSINKDNLASFMKAVIYGSLVIFIIVLAVYFSNFHNGFSDKQEVWGNFGDFLGGVLNPIFGLFGLVALLITISLQTKELEATHIELRRSAHAQELMEKTAKEQSITMERQRFDSTFFSLLDHHKAQQHSALQRLSQHQGSYIGSILYYCRETTNTTEAYKAANKMNGVEAQYFIVLQQLLRFIYLNFQVKKIGDHEMEALYRDLVISSVENSTLQALAFRCAKDDIEEKTGLKSLLEHYQLLKPINWNSFDDLLVEETMSYYQTAFGD